VKIRGYRVELSEVESVLCELEGVASAVVDVQEGAGGGKALVAC
jgi:acyl-coenzyme A synthetase/AMP-(fatty) acid ligase